jgi:crotonobetainyl-CoA:carnitine CoA-transferase CaiB-like acyl-CoA transferase
VTDGDGPLLHSMAEDRHAGSLADLKVIDLCGRKGGYCGKLLADLGADVILIEPPGGNSMRREGPFRDQTRHPEESLSFHAYHTNKRGLVLDLQADAGLRTFREMARRADVVIDDWAAGSMDGLGIGHAALQRLNPGLVTASITGFGESGPYSAFRSTNLIATAMSGLMFTAGFPGRSPLQGPGEAAYKLAGIHAAFGILVAVLNRRGLGRGQHVEVSMQEVLAADPFRRMVLHYSVMGDLVQRDGTVSPELFAGSYPALDGFVNLYVQVPAHWRRFVQWLGSPLEIADPSFELQEVQQQHRSTIDRLTKAKTLTYGKQALTEELQAEHLAAGAINTPAEFLADPQTVHRHFVAEVNHPQLGRTRHPGDPYIFSRTPWRIERAAPLLDQHRDEVESELGETTPVKRPVPRARMRPLLEGIRVVSFPTGVVGPCIGRLLGDHGAEVIAIEPRERPEDAARKKVSAWTLAQVESNRSRSRMSLNMATEEGRDLARRLIAKADVVTENFSARVMRKWGLDYQNVQKIKPDIVMISLQSFGNDGPRSEWISYGSTLLALSGYTWLWQDPGMDEQGVGCNTYFPDYVAPSYGALAVLAALNHRARTGQGQYIDLSQAETAASLLGTEFLEFLVGGREPRPEGNSSAYMAPHNCYPCAGRDRWCVIAVEDDAQWSSFCRATEHPEWETDSRFTTLESRRRHCAELDALVVSWTKSLSPHQVMIKLQRAGVAAGVVATSEDLYLDPHLRARGFHHDVQNAQYGWMTQVGMTANLSTTPGKVRGPAPVIGGDNERVLRKLLKINRGQFKKLEAAGAFG